MRRYCSIILAFFIASRFTICCAAELQKESPLLKEIMQIEKQKKFRALADVSSFTINYIFANKVLENSLEQALINALQKIGTVFSDDDSKLTEDQRGERSSRKKLGIFITAHQLVEEPIGSTNGKKLPVIQIKLEVSEGILLNDRIQTISIWEREVFVDVINDKQKLIEQADKVMCSLVDSFIQDYNIVNSGRKVQKPIFFVANRLWEEIRTRL